MENKKESHCLDRIARTQDGISVLHYQTRDLRTLNSRQRLNRKRNRTDMNIIEVCKYSRFSYMYHSHRWIFKYKIVSDQLVREHPYAKSLLHRISALEHVAREREDELAKMKREATERRDDQLEFERRLTVRHAHHHCSRVDLLTSQQEIYDKSIQDIRAGITKRDNDINRLRAQRDQQASEVNELRQKDQVKFNSLNEMKLLVESRAVSRTDSTLAHVLKVWS